MAKLSLKDATALAESEWDPVWSVEEIDTPPGSVVRHAESEHYGKQISQQFRVRLWHGNGPLHFIAILSDGGAVIK